MTKVLYPAGSAQIPSPKDAPKSGEMLSDSAYGPMVVEGLNLSDVKTGDPLWVSHGKGKTVEVPAASATTFAKAATIEFKNSTGLAVADAAGDFDIGKAAAAKTAGQTSVKIVMG
ncbi:capsid cement protein [Allorhodopirellula heiligendammensis]|uniref:Uncharacterized protein n=1 Tax=Allorhodopirellula heiligendammensis TaxID=2714739 RepID=A0A5C6BUL8_9BACT|nr:capsid cement protein [Allorhodopirellula heiligendammensis]TWU15963.1 hypothetical protein Poly21_31670 [Allorhodopirellula heiligendammensis]